MHKKILFLSLAVLLLTGCMDTSLTLPLPKGYDTHSTPSKTNLSQHHSSTGFYRPINYKNSIDTQHKKTVHTTYRLNFSGNGYIKGIVEKVYFSKDKHNWIYYIKGLDFTNGKLNYAKVYARKKLAKLQDHIYAVIQNGTITSFYIYKSSKSYITKKKSKILKKSKQKKKIYKKVKKTSKTRQRKQLISVPQTEEVTF